MQSIRDKDRRSGRDRRKFNDNIIPPDERNGIERRANCREVIITGLDNATFNASGGSTELQWQGI